jgi:diguanylate cyclase (GGDEF)-like protein
MTRPHPKPLRRIATMGGVAAVCFVAGLISLQPTHVQTRVVVLSPVLGVALAVLLIFGYEVSPAILLGVFVSNLLRSGFSIVDASGVAAGKLLAALAAWYLLRRFARGREAFDRARDVCKFAPLAGLVGGAISATVGFITLSATRSAGWQGYSTNWCAWWLSDASALIVLTPFLLLWWENPKVKWTREQALEMALLFLGLFAAAFAVFGGVLPAEFNNCGLQFLCIPFLLWAAFRFGRREAATALFVLFALAAAGMALGSGPFELNTPNASLLALASFIGISAVAVLALAAEVFQHQRAQEQIHSLAVSDPLTGLANYRQMIEALESEIKRFGRTERPFVVLLLDLDGLKKINDAHGHLMGSRALCRLADMLRLYSREMDTAARYGGDEFVLILPETDAEGARLVAQRITKRLAEDGEEPKLSVSIGTAICPEDGETIHELLNVADHDLYREKGVPKRKFVLPS